MCSTGHFQAVKNPSKPDELPPPSADSVIAFMCTFECLAGREITHSPTFLGDCLKACKLCMRPLRLLTALQSYFASSKFQDIVTIFWITLSFNDCTWQHLEQHYLFSSHFENLVERFLTAYPVCRAGVLVVLFVGSKKPSCLLRSLLPVKSGDKKASVNLALFIFS